MLRLLSLVVLFTAVPVAAQTAGWFPRKAGECGWVHGRYAIYNGSGLRRIWVIGTNHLMSLRDDDEDVPLELDPARWAPDGPINKAVYGDFFVCAAERFKPGQMQHVHIRRVRNLVVAPL